MKKQIVIIHGGDTFDTYEEYLLNLRNLSLNFERTKLKGWKESLGQKLGDEYEIIMPTMPNKANAKYLEWKIWFDKLVPFLESEVILIGNSLGAIFLPKYLSENDFPKKVVATFLVAAPFDAEGTDYSLADFVLPSSLERFEKQGGKIFIYQSKDDPVVPFANAEKYKKSLPNAELCPFEDRQHFGQLEFPEIIEKIKKL